MCMYAEHANQMWKGKKEEERTLMARQPGSLSPLVFNKMIVIQAAMNVETYLELFKDGCPDSLRPMVCLHCQGQLMLHRHGHYERMVYFLDKQFLIVVYRFKCPNCNHADGLLPSFVGKNQQAAWDIQETVLREQAAGASLADVAENLDDVPGGPYAEKTLWHWVSRWSKELPRWTPAVWAFVLERIPHAKIPVGAKKTRQEWAWLFDAWDQMRAKAPGLQGENLLQWLCRQAYSVTVAVG